jgi:predicted hotdog family 3-hydroxylacyl-ACP dehydratase
MMVPRIPDIERLVPHRAPMLLIDRIVEATEDAVTAETRIDPQCIFAVGNEGVPSYVGLEMMAQTVCAFDGLRRFEEGLPPPLGFLLGCRRYTVRRPYLVPCAVLTITARMLLHDGDMASFDCSIRDDDTTKFAEGALNVYRPANPEAILRRRGP